MIEMGIGTGVPGNPVLAVQVNHEKSYAFVEFRSAEDATAAMAFDGIIFQNGPLKIRRPKDYAGPDLYGSSGVHVPGVVSTNVPDSINKIFVGGLPTYLNEAQVMELLSSFGELKAFNLVKDTTTGLSKGFAFFEYVDPSVTDIATQGLNGLELGDRFLVVQRASIGAKPGMHNMPGMPSAEEYQSAMQGRPFIPMAANVEDMQNSRILLMLNMVSIDDLQDDAEYADIVEDVKEECGRYGKVLDVRIPRPAKKENKWAPGGTGVGEANPDESAVGRVYIKFESTEGAGEALKALAGRSFAARSIVATLLSDDAQTSPPLSVIFADEE
jgi:splicing factor U2AF subunit